VYQCVCPFSAGAARAVVARVGDAGAAVVRRVAAAHDHQQDAVGRAPCARAARPPDRREHPPLNPHCRFFTIHGSHILLSFVF
jgi:hypothetical protein